VNFLNSSHSICTDIMCALFLSSFALNKMCLIVLYITSLECLSSAWLFIREVDWAAGPVAWELSRS
jgi:hypothetical protein